MPIERIHFWGIGAVWLFYVLAAVAVAVFLMGVFFRVSVWMAGRADGRSADRRAEQPIRRAIRRVAAKAGAMFLDGLLGRRIYKGDVWAGLMHSLIMWGFIGLFVGTVLAIIDHWLFHFLRGDTYLIYSLCLELLGLMLLAGLLIALVRRYVLRVRRLENEPKDVWILVLLFFCAVSGFVVEGTRLAALTPDWEGYSFTGLGLASWLPSGSGAEAFYPYIWWFHAGICLGLVAYFPFSKLFHAVAAPVNISIAPRVGSDAFLAGGAAGAGSNGGAAADVPRFDFRDLVSLSSCTRCGRCDEICPSASALEPFSPREFITQADRFARVRLNPLTRIRWFRERLLRAVATVSRISPEQIWFCTTCRACLEVCPAYIGALEPIGRVRQAEVEEGSRLSPLLINALEMLYRFDNPWEPSKRKRSEWTVGLTMPERTGPAETAVAVAVPDLTEGATADTCYWVGCTTAFDTRAQKLGRAFVKIMTHAGVSFATLGQKETCCGDIARRAGELGLFEEQVEKTVTLLEKYSVTDLVTSSPHCFNQFRNEYARRQVAPAESPAAVTISEGGGASFRARHYTQFLEELLDQGRLRPVSPLGTSGVKVTYHDPCYLGRYNGIYEGPRRLLRFIPGLDLVEMPHHGPDSLCCGGGGGRMWQELEGEQKLGEVRAKEAANTGAEILVTACPYCLIMLEDAVKTADLEERLRVRDLNEVLAQSLGLGTDGD